MLLIIANCLSRYLPPLRVFHYLTFRSSLTAISAFFFTLWLGPLVIRKLTSAQIDQPIRNDGPQSHLKKSGTPTMGGVLILLIVILTTLLWGQLDNRYLWLILLTLLSFGAIGFYDDYLKLILRNSRGLTVKQKFLTQALFAILITSILYFTAQQPVETQLFFPFFKKLVLPLGILFIPFTSFVIVGTSNAVNLTDGLDGLAILPIVMIAGALGIFAYLSGHLNFARYLLIPHLPGTGEIVIFCSAILGAGLGFLWFNTYPAQIFMGDVGSLGLGATLGTIAVAVRQEFTLMIMGGIFVVEALSVIIQIFAVRFFNRRVFKMAPLHHHFELKGWPEPRVIVRFWIITCILVLLGLTSLKLR